MRCQEIMVIVALTHVNNGLVTMCRCIIIATKIGININTVLVDLPQQGRSRIIVKYHVKIVRKVSVVLVRIESYGHLLEIEKEHLYRKCIILQQKYSIAFSQKIMLNIQLNYKIIKNLSLCGYQCNHMSTSKSGQLTLTYTILPVCLIILDIFLAL